MKPKPVIVYHRADFDGLCCREIAERFMPTCDLMGWDFGDPKIKTEPNAEIYVMDLPPDCLESFPECSDSVVWIDHHKTSIEKFSKNLRGYRIDGVAACRLAWQWFTADGDKVLPEKDRYISRQVDEPIAVRLIGEYDIWDKRDWRADVLQYGLRAVDHVSWNTLLSSNWVAASKELDCLLAAGEAAKRYAESINVMNMRSSFFVHLEGLVFLALNGRGNSLTFKTKDNTLTGHNALMLFYFDGFKWTVSLYHAEHNKEVDLSIIAKKYGGGGHKGACGFQMTEFPFFLKRL